MQAVQRCVAALLASHEIAVYMRARLLACVETLHERCALPALAP